MYNRGRMGKFLGPNEYVHRADGVSEIVLMHGLRALIDTADYDLVRQHRWFAELCRKKWYVRTNIRDSRAKSGHAKLHLERLLLVTELPTVDHRDGDGLNNRRLNLRGATYGQNKFNCKHKTGGITLMPDKRAKPWAAHIGYQGRKISRYFLTESEARAARKRMEEQYYGDFPREYKVAENG